MRDWSRAVELRCDQSNRIRPGVGHGRNRKALQWLDQEVHVVHLWDAVNLHGHEFATLVNQCLGEKTVVDIALPACH